MQSRHGAQFDRIFEGPFNNIQHHILLVISWIHLAVGRLSISNEVG